MVGCTVAAPTFQRASCLRLPLLLRDHSGLPDIIQGALPAHTTEVAVW